MDDKELKTKETVEEDNTVLEANTTEEVKQDVGVTSINETQEGYELIPNNKKDNKVPIIIMAIIIIALAAVLYFAYTFISNPKKVFVKSVNKGYKEVENFIDEMFEENTNKKSMVLSNDLKVKVEMDESLVDDNTKGIIDEINKIKLETEIGYDQKNKQMLMTMEALYDNKTLIDLGAYAKEENMYFELKDLFDKYIEVPMDDYDTYFEESSVDIDDLKYVLSKTKDSYINNLDEDNFKKSNSTIKINGKKEKVKKITYLVSKQKGHELSKKALTKLVKDSKYIEALANLSGEDKDEIKESMEEKIDELTEEIESGDLETKNSLSLVVYTKGLMGKVVGYEILLDDEESGKMSYYKGKEKDEFKFVYNDEEVINAKISDNKFVIEVTSEGETVKLDVLKKEKGKKTTYSYTLSADGASISGDVVVEMIKENKDGSYKANISSSASLMGMMEITISGTSELKYKDSLKLPDVSNNVNYEELTEDDMNKIKTKLLENKTIISLITKINSYSNNTSSY